MGGKAGPRLTQRRFAELLRNAQAGYEVGNLELGAQTGIDATTISRYRNPEYPSGPPAEPKRRMLERALGAPEGYLDGRVELSVEEMRNEARNGSATRQGLSTHQVTSASAISADVRPPRGEKARETLETRIGDVIRGAPLTPAELDYWLKLVRWAATTDVAGDALEAAQTIEATDLQTPPAAHRQGRGRRGA